MMKRALYPIVGGAVGGFWGYLCNNYLGWPGVVVTAAVAFGVALWALRSLHEMRAMEREFEDRLHMIRMKGSERDI
ncbi:MAG TPA: hypothetical protein VH110_05220 [Candidatus Acidoferrum sp.]|jgi:hypothetical protein|nr:hypothetical protein [Candidatus Acidoferrum sp.]